jgi:hypothetical protein
MYQPIFFILYSEVFLIFKNSVFTSDSGQIAAVETLGYNCVVIGSVLTNI